MPLPGFYVIFVNYNFVTIVRRISAVQRRSDRKVLRTKPLGSGTPGLGRARKPADTKTANKLRMRLDKARRLHHLFVRYPLESPASSMNCHAILNEDPVGNDFRVDGSARFV
jgi:hypothetical protein